MKNARSVGLVGSGEATRLFFAKATALANQLGPVKSSSYRVASRIVNGLRAGEPVSDATSLGLCNLVLICVDAGCVHATVAEMVKAELDWKGRSVILCDVPEDAATLSPLAALGAHTASINTFNSEGKMLWIAEGDDVAIRDFKRILLPRATPVLQLAPGTKQVFLAGLTLASLPLYLHVVAVECLRAAGIGVGYGRGIAQALSIESIRAATKTGRQAIAHRSSEAGWEASRVQLSALRSFRPDLADVFANAMKLVSEFPDAPE